MARLLVYGTSSRQIKVAFSSTISAGDWSNSATYMADKKITVDGVDRVVGLGGGMSALNFSGTIPDGFEDTFGDEPTIGLIWELNAGLDTIQEIT